MGFLKKLFGNVEKRIRAKFLQRKLFPHLQTI